MERKKMTSRRAFFKIAGAMAMGAAAAYFTTPFRHALDESMEDLTGIRSGSALGYEQNEKIDEACKGADAGQNNKEQETCNDSYRQLYNHWLMGILEAPFEEIACRAMPGMLYDKYVGNDNPLYNMIGGTGGLGMTKGEVFMGGVSSLVFGAAHNFTSKGFDAKTIPASQITGGFVYWYLQRKLGLAANTTAHIWYNYKAMA